ncbi:membrane protein [gut metagenome]|uniref:Membrane protein n=1 Tax=gut metagenome TaxID=749906 RepID=J9FUU2_9ZZZZ
MTAARSMSFCYYIIIRHNKFYSSLFTATIIQKYIFRIIYCWFKSKSSRFSGTVTCIYLYRFVWIIFFCIFF